MARRTRIIGAVTVLALAPLHAAAAATNPLGTSYGSMTARGCYMAYRLAPMPDATLEITGSISCSDPYGYFEEMSVTVLDNGQVVNDDRLSGEPGCGYAVGATEVGCRFPAERGHAYTVVYGFYMEGEGYSSSVRYPHDPPNAGTCGSSPFTSSEIDYLSCSAALHYIRT